MFDVGFAELVFLAVLGLVFLGPKRLPRVAAQLGRWVGQARRMSRTLMYQLRQEVNLDDPQPFSARRPAESATRSSPKKADDGATAKPGSDEQSQAEAETPSGQDEAAKSQSGE